MSMLKYVFALMFEIVIFRFSTSDSELVIDVDSIARACIQSKQATDAAQRHAVWHKHCTLSRIYITSTSIRVLDMKPKLPCPFSIESVK